MVSLHDDYSLEAPPPFAGMVIERPASYKPSLLATRAPLIRYFIQRFDDSKSTAVEMTAQSEEQQECLTMSIPVQADPSFRCYPTPDSVLIRPTIPVVSDPSFRFNSAIR